MSTQYSQDTELLHNICDAEIASDKEFHEVFAKDTSYDKTLFRQKVYLHVSRVRRREDLKFGLVADVANTIVNSWITQREAELQFINNKLGENNATK